MYAIKAVYDGNSIIPKEPIPVKEYCDVVITFMEPGRPADFRSAEKKRRDKILGFFNTWDSSAVDETLAIMEEREHFSRGRSEP